MVLIIFLTQVDIDISKKAPSGAFLLLKNPINVIKIY
jgi:hypothetical protein